MSIPHNPLSPLSAIFSPKRVALIGATEKKGSVGRTILRNLIETPFGGTVYPVNPKRESVLGIRAYPTIAAISEPIDLAIVVTPAPTVPGIIAECAAAGVRGAIVISAGFRELGAEGVELERRVREAARESGMRILGPNCLGAMNPTTGLNATFANGMALKGKVAFISQSGALCTAILDWSHQQRVGFSLFVSLGSMLDIGWGDLIDYLGDDPKTESILVYMESVGDARSFFSAAREVALEKPIIVIKAGRSREAAQAAVSHTGSLAGSDEVLDAAFRRCGILRVDGIHELFHMAGVLSRQPRPSGRNLTVLTNAGGPGVLATDALIAGGGKLAKLSQSTGDALNEFLPPHWSRSNPVDILGDAGPDRYSRALAVTAADPESDGLLVILTPQDMTDPTSTAEALTQYASSTRKPVLASWMGGGDVAQGIEILNRAGIPTFPYPDSAARAFNFLWRYSDHLTSLYETPAFLRAGRPLGEPNRDRAAELIATTLASGRTVMTESESKDLLATYGVPIVVTHVASDADSAVRTAARIGYPVVLKLHSETVTHKSDVGGVRLDLADEAAVRSAFHEIRAGVLEHAGEEAFGGVTVQAMLRGGIELILGCSQDAQFGPVILFGAGGKYVEIFGDRSLALPPLNTTLSRRMIERTKIHKALRGVRGEKPVDTEALEHLVSRFSQLVVEQRRIREIDINPLVVSSERQVALDARGVLHPTEVADRDLPKLTIRPYPIAYVSRAEFGPDASVTIRPIRPEDETLLVKFHEALSEQSVRFRYLHPMKLGQRISHQRLSRICFVDYDREMAIVAERGTDDSTEIVGVGRLSRPRGRRDAEFAVVVTDPWQKRGIGTAMMQRLVDIAKSEHLEHVHGRIHPENIGMRKICEKLGFSIGFDPEERCFTAILKLPASRSPASGGSDVETVTRS